MIYQSNSPYPTPRVEETNRKYALILLSNYAGDISEETAIHQYLFQYLMKNNELEEFASAMIQISTVEMEHLRLLGETIKLLGIMPVFGKTEQNKNYKPWCSNNVNYTTDIKTIILQNIKYENEAIKKYKYSYSQIKDVYVRELINRIIEDELIHIEIFKNFYLKFIEN